MKKKLLVFITLLMMIFNINYIVNADSDSPTIRNYKVVVKNKKGTSLYNEDGKVVDTIPYKGVATVMYEARDKKNNEILYITYKDYDDVWNPYYIKAEDTIPKEYEISNENKLETKQEVIVLNKEGSQMYEGPAEIYDKLSKIVPNETSLTYQYYSYDYEWIYIEYDGVKGWIKSSIEWIDDNKYSNYVVDKSPSNLEMLSINDAKLYSSIYRENNEIIDTIDSGTKLNCKYEYNYSICYVEYNGKLGWVNLDNNFVYKETYGNSKEKYFVLSDMYLYKDSKFKNKFNVQIPSNTYIEDFYHESYADEPGVYGSLYVKYKNQYGWLNPDEKTIAYCDQFNEVTIDKNLNMYEKPDINSEVITTLPKDTLIKSQCEIHNYDEEHFYNWIYIEYNNVNGWINEDDLYSSDDPIDEGNKPNDEEIENNPSDEPIPNEAKWYEKLTPVQFALLCIGGALLLAVTAIVIIVLIKKKNNKKAKENKKDNSNDKKIDENKNIDKDTDKTKDEPVKTTEEQDRVDSNETEKEQSVSLENQENANKEESDKK